jgi:DNA-3-methyladenine glycosylase II
VTDKLDLHRKARRHLSRCDSVLKSLIKKVGDCTLQPGGECFAVLVRSIVAQMISTAVARTIAARIETAVGSAGITPESLLALGEKRLREQGLSGAKVQAILDLATRAKEGTLPLLDLTNMEDEKIIEHLTAVRGIGVWTAEMFLIFCLGRADVLPVGDLGLRAGVQEQYGLEELPGKAELRKLAEPWRPYRSIATWYMWRSRGFVPQSE